MRTNFVGRSFVSAITHTPASGPRGPVTTPPMSSGPTFTEAEVVGRAAIASATNAAMTAPTPKDRVVVTCPPLRHVEGDGCVSGEYADRPTRRQPCEYAISQW